MSNPEKSRQCLHNLSPTPLQATSRTFKIGLDSFGGLGQAVFKELLERQWMQVIAINVSGIDAEQVVSILGQPGLLPKTCEVRIAQPGTDGLDTLNIVDRTFRHSITLFHESDPARIPWQSVGIFHVIQSSDISAVQVEAHLHAEGARRVVVAGMSDAPRFNPNAKESRMAEQLRERVLTSGSLSKTWMPMSMLYRAVRLDAKLRQHSAKRAVDLLEDILSRDAVGACYLWAMTVDGRSGCTSWEEDFEGCLDSFLGPHGIGAEKAGSLEGGAIWRASAAKADLITFAPQKYCKACGLYICGAVNE